MTVIPCASCGSLLAWKAGACLACKQSVVKPAYETGLLWTPKQAHDPAFIGDLGINWITNTSFEQAWFACEPKKAAGLDELAESFNASAAQIPDAGEVLGYPMDPPKRSKHTKLFEMDEDGVDVVLDMGFRHWERIMGKSKRVIG